MPLETDVIIIGAGAAGLAAAKELDQLGKTYILVEGSHRIGGRAASEEIAPSVWLDRGCAWLVEGTANPFVPIAAELGIPIMQDKGVLFQPDSLRLYRNSVPLDAEQIAACQRYFDGCEHAISVAAKQGRDVPLSDVIDLAHEFAPPFKSDVAAGWGLDVDLVSTVDHASAYGELGFPVQNGYGNLVTAWGADVPVSLNCQVKRIDWTAPLIKVETSKGILQGRTILCTVSTGVLASGDIKFNPKLPDWKVEAIAQLPMGTENKIGVYFSKDVFGRDGYGHYSTWNEEGEASAVKIEAGVMGQNTAVVFVGGRQGVLLETQSPEACHAFAVQRLADVFGNDIRQHVKRSIATAWKGDQWTRGAWAVARPGHAHQRANLARSVDDRLFFAGEATMIGLQGTCHGAYLSGIKVAKEIASKK